MSSFGQTTSGGHLAWEWGWEKGVLDKGLKTPDPKALNLLQIDERYPLNATIYLLL